MKKILLFLLTIFIAWGSNAQIAKERIISTKNQGIFCLAYSKDGKYIAVGGDHKEIIIYQNGSFNEVARLGGLKETPLAVTFSNDGKKIAAGGYDKKVTLWSIASKQIILTLKGHKDQVMALKFSPDDKFIASASNDKSIIYWNTTTGLAIYRLTGHSKEVLSIDISPNGEYLVSGSIDESIKIWNLKTGVLKLTLPGHSRAVRAVAFSPDGSLIASGGDDHMMHLWDAYNGEKLNTFLGHKKWIETIAFSPDGNYLLSGGHDRIILLTDLKTGMMVFQSPKQENYIRAVAFNPKGETFSSAALFAKELMIWNASYLSIKPVEVAQAQKASTNSGFAPKVELISPIEGTNLTTPSAKVNARITSMSSLRSIELYLNGQLFAKKDRSDLMLETSSTDITTYEESVVLNEGENTIQLKATNIVGEGISQVVKITYSIAPIELLSWIIPAEANLSTNMDQFRIKAMVSASSSNQRVDVYVNDNLQLSLPFADVGGLLDTIIQLNPGINTIRVKVTTPKYSKDATLRVVNFEQAAIPFISWIVPSQDTTVNISTARVNAKLASKVPLSQVQIKVNGVAVFNKESLEESNYELNEQIPLSTGNNTITVHARNNAGEAISPTRSVTYMLPSKTNISWLAPATSQGVYTANYELKACIQSKTSVTKIEVYNNDQLIISEYNPPSSEIGECNINFTKQVLLNLGINTFKIIGENSGGKTESELISLTYTQPVMANVTWISPITSPVTSSKSSINVDACVQSNAPVSKLSVWVNNVVVSSELNPTPLEGTDCQYPVKQLVSLNNGTNNIVIKATNPSGETVSTPLIVDQKTTNPYRFALIIGNEDYSSFQLDLNSESDVDFAINDAKAFKDMCISSLGVPSDNIRYLENARYIEMMKELKKINGILKVTQGKAELLVFYAGHGFPDEKSKEPYLVPVDGSGTDLEFSAVKLSYFYEQLTEFPAKRITVFLDACFSGGARNQGLVAARGVKIVPNEPTESVKKKLVVFTASSGSQTSLPYKEKEHGLFTYYVLKKFEESNGSLTYKGLSDYVREQVGIKAYMVNSKEQTPQTNVSPEVQSEWATWNFFE